MADLLGATNRVAGYESIQNNRTPLPTNKPDPRIQNAPDPSRISRPDARTEQQGADNPLQSGALRYDSNFQAFLAQLRQAPDLAQMLGRLVVLLRSTVATPGMAPGIAQEMATLLGMLRMDRETLLTFFTNQMQGESRFGGPLFDLLRQAYRQMPDEGARGAILRFAQKYIDYSSLGHISENLNRGLRQIQDYLPQSWRGQLAEWMAQLENDLAAGSRESSLKLLQGQILPYLGAYVERSHNVGTIRTLIGMLCLDMARLENTSQRGLLAAFRQLGGYGGVLGSLNQLDDTALLRLMQQTPFQKAAQQDAFAQQLAAAARRALAGELGVDAREGFQEILRSVLLNESVYLPLNHIMLPLEWEGKMLYSEVWVDPDAGRDKRRRGEDGQQLQFLFKMDVQSLGAMEMVLSASQDQGVALRVLGPDTLARHQALIARDLETILTDRGLHSRGIQVGQLKTPLTLTEVFPGLFDGKEGVDVRA